MWRDWLFRLRALVRGKAMDADLDAELRDHLAHQVAWHEAHGLSRDAAARQARVDLGAGEESLKEDCRDERGTRWARDAWRDIAYAVHTLRRSPGFAAVATSSLALGLGANIAVFGVLNAFLLKPLPIRSPDQVVFVEGGRGQTTQSYPNYRDFRDRTSTLSGLAAYRLATMGIARDGSTDETFGYLVTGNYFEMLGVEPWLGRLFTPTDDTTPHANPVAVVSYAFWTTRFGRDPALVGRSIRINTKPYTVVGVLPPAFHGTERFFWPDVWVPMSMEPDIEPVPWLDARATFNCELVGRLAPGLTAPQATTDLNGIAAALAREYPDIDGGLSVRLTSPGWLGDALGAPVAAFTRGLMALAALVLLAACVNLASLLSARATDRARELAIRLAIGASRWRIVRQLLVEALVLVAAGGVLGAALATALLRLLSQWRVGQLFPIRFDVTADWRVFVFAGCAAALTTLLFSLGPARLAWRVDLTSAWKGTSGPVRGRRWTTRDALVGLQVAICCVLVLSALLATRGLTRALAAPIGMRPDHVDAVGFDLGLARYSADQSREFRQRALDAVVATPGVTSAAYADTVPLYLDQSTRTVFRDDATDFRLNAGANVSVYSVSPNYFATIGTSLLNGRDFTNADDDRALPVAIVNETFARHVLRTENPVGARFRYGRTGQAVEIVGLVEDGKYVTMIEDARAALFRPQAQTASAETIVLARTRPGGAPVTEALRRVVAALDPNVPVYISAPVRELLGLAFLPMQAATLALGAFGVLALMLALTGIYGVAEYAVSKRVREIGIRVAVGARPSQVLRTVLGRIILLTSAGTLVGLAVAVLAAPLLKAVVYGTARADVRLGVESVSTMVAVALLAAWLPARRALRVDPITTLRAD